MVQLMSAGKATMESESRRRKMVAVKMEADESSEDDRRLSFSKRSRHSFSPLALQHNNLGPDSVPVPPAEYNPLDEPSPLGLSLKKSPSLLELIQMTLSKGNGPKLGTQVKKEQKGSHASTSASCDKLKASNFPASFLRIGTWEYKSRYEGDLVAKCYFAKHKLVWEVLDGGLKNKIEIQWSDIMALKATYPDDGPGTLDVVLSRQPLFFRETNPQPRKHTLWQATSDFTGGEASINRRHYLQCPQGLLGKHFEKLVLCDPRLNFLSQQGDIVLDTPYFEPRVSVFDDSNESDRDFDLNPEKGQAVFNLKDAPSPSRAQSSSSLTVERRDLVGIPTDQFSRETPSPCSVMDTRTIGELRNNKMEELKRLIEQDQIKVPGLHPSMSMSDLVDHIEHRITEQRTSSNNNFTLSDEDRQSLSILEEISRCLFTDSQHIPASDEKCIMSRVNSLCCLLQKDPQNLHIKGEDGSEPSENKPPGMTRKDSVGELLLNLPRIASLPQFLFNISE